MKKFVLAMFLILISSVAFHANIYANVNIVIDNEQMFFETPAQIVNDRTMLPMRSVFYAIEPDIQINWIEQTRSIEAHTPLGDIISMSLDSYDFYVNGNLITIDVTPQILVDGFTFVPVRVIAEALGAYVEWDHSTATVSITTRDNVESNYFVNLIVLEDIEDVVDLIAIEQAVFYLVNQTRVSYGLPPFVWNETLAQAARNHSIDMAENNFIGHYGSDGSNVGQRIRREGLTPNRWAENVVIGLQTPEQAMEGWMNSYGHRANILREINYIGVGVVPIEHLNFQIFAWTQKFME